MRFTAMELPDYSRLEENIGYRFADRQILANALRHRSYVHEHPEGLADNERMEFLGDAVLNLIVSHLLMERFPSLTEGDLSRVRAGLVNEDRLAAAAKSIHLGDHLMRGHGVDQGQFRHFQKHQTRTVLARVGGPGKQHVRIQKKAGFIGLGRGLIPFQRIPPAVF